MGEATREQRPSAKIVARWLTGPYPVRPKRRNWTSPLCLCCRVVETSIEPTLAKMVSSDGDFLALSQRCWRPSRRQLFLFPLSLTERRPPTLLEKNGRSVERTPRQRARKSPSEELQFGKVGSLDVSRCLQLRQGSLIEFCHLGLQDPLPAGHRATIFLRRATISSPTILVLQ